MRALSSTHQGRVEIETLFDGVDFSGTLTHAQVEEIIDDLFKNGPGCCLLVATIAAYLFGDFRASFPFWASRGISFTSATPVGASAGGILGAAVSGPWGGRERPGEARGGLRGLY